MTASPQADSGSRSDHGNPDSRAPEDLVDELGKLAGEVLDDLERRLDRKRPEIDLGELRPDVITRVTGDWPALLSEVKSETAALEDARQALSAHRHPPGPPAGPPDLRDKRAHAALGAALALGVLGPVAFWQFLQAPLSPTGHFWVAVAVVVVGFALLRPIYVAVERAGRRLTGVPARGGAGWPLVTGFVTVYLLMLWRYWTAFEEFAGPVLSKGVWIVAGVGILVLAFGAYAATNEPARPELKARRIPTSVVGREVRVTAVAMVLAALVLTGVVPVPGPDWVSWSSADVLALLTMVLGGPLVLSARLPRWLSRDVSRVGSRGWKQQEDRLAKKCEEAMSAWRKAAEGPVRQLVVHHTNEARHPPFSTVLPSYDPRALGRMRADQPIARKTAAGQRLEMVLAGLSGGAVGVAGPRGAGKSTWLEAFRDGKLQDFRDAHIALLESVPVRYDMREFVLYLYARMCGAVIKFCDGPGGGDAGQPAFRPVWRARLRRWWPFAAIVASWLVLGLAGSLSLRDPKVDIRTWLTSLWWPVVSLFGVGGLLAVAVRHRPAGPPAPAPSRAGGPGETPPEDLPALRRLAVDRLEEIEFQQKHTAGWSGKVGVLAGAEVGLSGSREVTRQPRTYPQIVRDFGEFLRATVACVEREPGVATPSVVIILDELDKIATPEAAQDFVNEIKALVDVGVPGFLLLVSVSEDALASFERRGLPVRDAFDSTFDVILRLEYLTLGEAKEMLSNRVLGLPEPFTCLAHCLAGGLPRELIRVTREMIRESGSLPDVAHRMVAGDLRNKLGALRTVVAHGTYDDVAASELVRHVDAHAVADPAVLLRAVRQPPAAAGHAAEPASLHRLRLETLGYLYYLATVLEVFGAGFAPADLDRGRTEGDTSFDTLGSVRQLFSVNARLAWLTVSAFRQAWELATVAPPDADEAGR
ncbi:transcriptional regulator [Amycolatopsis sp. NPDC051106]|uniref:transcriptional regulator n=1 Tax=unclassified Amycolatopsis TaxID=2618356 RepID=UPI0034491FED